jgi:glycosyltransferase involved in cell wall biosynthesis
VTELHHAVDSLAPFDAISDEVRALRDALAAVGIGGAIHAAHVHPSLRDEARPLAELRAGAPVLLHHSIGSPAVDAALAAARPLLVRYQNVTPARWFRGVNGALADAAERGRADLVRLAPRTALAVAPSGFSAAELQEAGFAAVEVVPILLPEPPGGYLGHLSNSSRPVGQNPEPFLLTVGRVAPHKRIDEALRVFACYRRGCAPGARLAVVGSDTGFEPYGRACRRLAGALGIAGAVDFTGTVPEGAKRALLARADAYLACTEHEGFCVPLVEAMRASLPIVARAEAAVPETVGRGGVVVPTRDHAVLAELVHAVAGDPLARAAARREAGRYAPGAIGERLVGALTTALR